MSRLTRRNLLRASSVGALGAAGAVALAACGETVRTVTKEVPVEKIVIKEVPVDRIVQKTQIKEVPVEKIVEKTTIQKQIVEKVVTRIVKEMVPAKPNVRKITAVTDWNSGARLETMDLMESEYVKRFPHVQEVDIWHLGGGSSTTSIGLADAVITTQIVGEGPDVFIEFNERAEEWHLDMSPWIKQFGINKEDYIWQDASVNTRDGVPRFLPFNIGLPCWFYNEDLFAANGVGDPPLDGLKWSEFDDTFKQLTDVEAGTYGFQMTTSSWHWGLFDLLMSEGSLPYDPNPILSGSSADTRTTLWEDSRKWGGDPVGRYEAYIDLAHKDKVGAPPSVLAALSAAGGVKQPYASGKIGVWSYGLQAFSRIVRAIDGRFTASATWPAMPDSTGKRSSIGGHSGLSVNVQTVDKGIEEEAANFAALWLDETILDKAIGSGAGGFMHKKLLKEHLEIGRAHV